MKRVVVESPFAPQTPPLVGFAHGDVCLSVEIAVLLLGSSAASRYCAVCLNAAQRHKEAERNLGYLRAVLRDSIHRGEAPFASHAIYTQPGVLDATRPDERLLGIQAGFAWGEQAELVAVYCDLGLSYGMEEGIRQAARRGTLIDVRRLGEPWLAAAGIVAEDRVRAMLQGGVR